MTDVDDSELVSVAGTRVLGSVPIQTRDDASFPIRLKRACVVGSKIHAAGSIVEMPVQAAKAAVLSGAGEPHVAFGRALSWLAQRAASLALPKPAPPSPPFGDYYRLESGSLFCGSRTFTPDDGPFQLPHSYSVDPSVGDRLVRAVAAGDSGPRGARILGKKK